MGTSFKTYMIISLHRLKMKKLKVYLSYSLNQ